MTSPARQRPLISILSPVRARLTSAVALQAVASAAGTGPLIAIAVIADRLLPPGTPDAGTLWHAAALGAAAAVVSLAAATAASVLSHVADNTLQLRLRRALADRLGRVPLDWYARRGSGQVKKVVHDDVQAMHYLVAHTALDVTTAVVTPLTALAYLSIVDWRLALLALVPLAAGVALFRRAMAGAGGKMAAFGRAASEINNGVVEFVDGIQVLKTFGRARSAHQRFARAADDFSAFFTGWVADTATVTTASQLVVTPTVVLLFGLGLGAPAVAAGWVNPAALVAYALLAPAVAGPIAGIGTRLQALRTGTAAATGVQTLLGEQIVTPPANPGQPDGTTVRLHRVDFSYDGVTDALTGVDLELRPGTVTALVGPSGAGKSTIAKLVARFVDATAGTVTIGGVDVRDLEPQALYRTVGFVFQDATLLRTTIAENIGLGRPEATPAEIEAAARAANIHDRITTSPKAYDAVVGVDIEFSGGEAQRVCIARALLADTPVLVLDEATAHADPHTEAEVQRALSALAAGRTLLVIAHRLASVRTADQIAVIDAGRIVQLGRHDDLLEQDGRYARLWHAQEHPEAVPAAPIEETP